MAVSMKVSCALFSTIAILCSLSTEAGAVVGPSPTIQVMPPLQLTATGSEDRCKQGEGHKLLSWNAASSVRCNPNVTVSSNSLMVGTATSGGLLYIGSQTASGPGGASINLEGASTYPNWTMDLYQNDLRLTSNVNLNNQVQIYNPHASGITGLYVEGNVGVGAVSPLTPLHVIGPQIPSFMGTTRGMFTLSGTYNVGSYTTIDFLYTPSSSPVARIAMQADGSGSKLVFGTSNNYAAGITNAAMTITQSGDVNVTNNLGVGVASPASKLDVAGGVKIGNDAAICAPAKSGTVRWDGTNMQYCNGSAWTNMGGGSPDCAVYHADTSGVITGGTRTIYSNEMMLYTCPAERPILMSGSCWRKNWGTFIGTHNMEDGKSYLCRIEASNGLDIWATCCK